MSRWSSLEILGYVEEIDGDEDGWAPFGPGESCWVDRCTNGPRMKVDYCEGEEPEEACP